MKKLGETFPPLDLKEITTNTFKSFTRNLVDVLEGLRLHIVDVVNFNSIDYISQAAKPTPSVGAMTIWKDSDATTGNPTHFIVYNDAGTVVTFASVELVP